MFYTYVLQSLKNDELYIGYTADLKRRLVEHNQGENPSTKRYIPWKIIYYEASLNKNDAMRREKYFKTTQGRRLLKRRLKEYFYEERSMDLQAEILLPG
jgi:putative endonuclease